MAQAFGRASVLSPEMYGTFFFLGDEDYPRLARLIQLHKQLEPMLKHSVPLPGGDIAHADGASSLVLVRNMTWEPALKSIPLDASIGLAAAPGTPLTVRQRHPWEMLMKRAGDGAVVGGTLPVELDPFSLRLIQIDTVAPAEPLVAGVPYEIVPGPDARSFDIKLLGTPGRKADVMFLNFGDRTVRTGAGQPVPTGDKPWPVAFPGTPAAGPSFARLAGFRDDPAAAVDGPRLAELAKFTIDDDALEIREMVRLKREPSNLAEIEACRAYMWDKVAAAEGTFRNAFDGDPGTRWSDGVPAPQPVHGQPGRLSQRNVPLAHRPRPADRPGDPRAARRPPDGRGLSRGRRDVRRSDDLDADGRIEPGRGGEHPGCGFAQAARQNDQDLRRRRGRSKARRDLHPARGPAVPLRPDPGPQLRRLGDPGLTTARAGSWTGAAGGPRISWARRPRPAAS